MSTLELVLIIAAISVGGAAAGGAAVICVIYLQRGNPRQAQVAPRLAPGNRVEEQRYVLDNGVHEQLPAGEGDVIFFEGAERILRRETILGPPLSPFEPPLMNPTDFLVFAILIFFVFSLLIYVVIRAAKTLLRTNHFVRIHQIDNTSVSQEHPYHLVDPSPWPLLGSLGALTSTIGAVMYMHSFTGDKILLTLGLGLILYTMFVWWRDVTRESTYEGHHTKVVQLGLRYGFILFIVSEVMFFLAFFWAFFHSSLAPAVEIGAIWPPKGVEVLNSQGIPFLNTLILLLSGAAVTWAHHAILAGLKEQAVYALVATVWLALVFTGFQGMEYYEAPFTISDGIYGSTFFLATGFHGFHVIIGTIFLMICGIRQYIGHFSPSHHFGFEAAAWYWHFVDVVWLFLFVSIYWWGGS